MGSSGQYLFGNQGWLQGALTNTFNNLQSGYDTGLSLALPTSAQVTNQAPTGMQQASQYLYGTPSGYSGVLTDVDDQMRQYGNFSTMSPYFSQNALGDQGQNYLNTLTGAGGQAGDLANYSNYYMGQGGQTDSTRSIYDRSMDLATGQGAQLGTMGDVGMDLVGNRGQTAYTQNLQDIASQGMSQVNSGLQGGQNYALNTLQGGGQTAGTNALNQYGTNVLGNSTGLTAAGQAGEAAALQQLQTGGATSLLSALQQNAISAIPSVTPQTGSLVSAAMDQAAASQRRNAEAQYRKAYARGGGPGSVVASGLQNQAVGEFENENMEAQASAYRDAQAKEIAAQQQAQQTALNTGLTAAQQQNQNLSTSGGLLTDLENMATGRLNTGISSLTNSGELSNSQVLAALQSLPEYSNAQTNSTNVYGNLGLNAAGQETANLTAGGNLLNNYNNTRLSGLNQASTAAGLENNMFINSGNLSNSLYGTQSNATNNALSQLLSGYNTGTNQASNLYSNYSNMVGNRLTGANTAANLYGTNINALNTAAGQGMGLAQTGLSGQSGLWSGQQSQGSLPSLINAAANAYSAYKTGQ